MISPEPVPTKGLGVGEVGYIITGVKDVRQSKVGDTITSAGKGATEALGGYRDPQPMVYSGLFPMDGSDFPLLRDALDKLRLNDAALTYEPESSTALGFGYRCGYLGLLHLEITRDRLEREFGLDLISTAPSVVYRVVMEDGAEHVVTNPSDWPEGKIAEVHEPIVQVHDHHAERVHRHDHGAVPVAARQPAAAWTTCPRVAGRAALHACRWPRSSSTSSTR